MTDTALPLEPAGWKLLKDSTHDERSWPEDAGHENGDYSCLCSHCGRVFTGHKRRMLCKVCSTSTERAVEVEAATKPVSQEPSDSEMALNAKRYRHMRESAVCRDRNGPGLYWYLPRHLKGDPGERLDAAIDAAMKGDAK